MTASLLLVLAVLASVVAAAADWWAVATRRPAVERWAKPTVMVGLLGVALALGDGHPVLPWVLVALALGLVGDVLLLEDTPTRFLGGLAAFLLGHLAWVVTFVGIGLDRPALAGVGAVLVVAALVVGRRILPAAWRDGGAALAAPVALYMAVIAAMALTGWATGHLLVGLGASLFVVSDTVLALRKFVAERPWHALAVITTYHLAQALLLVGLLA
ncbi:lysoplasmalogenase family protein [Phycicoccus avicenniae]|uniref:lysoplasmalogenase family protein n=1 Tax=Phycicoccus avicenniae TaxID=2828860 RepID=UPI003D27D0CC